MTTVQVYVVYVPLNTLYKKGAAEIVAANFIVAARIVAANFITAENVAANFIEGSRYDHEFPSSNLILVIPMAD